MTMEKWDFGVNNVSHKVFTGNRASLLSILDDDKFSIGKVREVDKMVSHLYKAEILFFREITTKKMRVPVGGRGNM